MPEINESDRTYLLRAIADTESRVAALETQQNFGVVDSNLAIRAILGLLPSGDYGLLLIDPATGQRTELLPLYEADVIATEATSSATYTDLTTPGPEVEATVGASGMVLLTVNSYVGVPGIVSAQSAGFVGVSIDSGTPSGFLDELLYFSVSSSASATGIAGNQSAQVIVSGLTPGAHTFELQYKTAGGGSVNFGKRFLQVRPI